MCFSDVVVFFFFFFVVVVVVWGLFPFGSSLLEVSSSKISEIV